MFECVDVKEGIYKFDLYNCTLSIASIGRKLYLKSFFSKVTNTQVYFCSW